MKLRCRLGLHKWARFKIDSGSAGMWEPGAPAGDGWETRCRYCRKKRRLLRGFAGGGIPG